MNVQNALTTTDVPCKPCTAKKAGDVVTAECSVSSDTVINKCDKGFAVVSGACVACEEGTNYMDVQNALTTNVACKTCTTVVPANKEKDTECTASADTTFQCASGFTSEGAAAGSCRACTKTPPANKVVDEECSATEDTTFKCDASKGYISASEGSGCVPLLCKVNERVVGNKCQACGNGKVKPAGDDATGRDTPCFNPQPEGTDIIQESTSYQDAIYECPAETEVTPGGCAACKNNDTNPVSSIFPDIMSLIPQCLDGANNNCPGSADECMEMNGVDRCIYYCDDVSDCDDLGLSEGLKNEIVCDFAPSDPNPTRRLDDVTSNAGPDLTILPNCTTSDDCGEGGLCVEGFNEFDSRVP